MDILMRYGFSIEEIKNMMDSNDELELATDAHVLEVINLLTSLGCHEEHIMNIFNCNPFVLSRDIKEIKALIKKLEKLDFKHIYIVLDSNPYLLNLTTTEVDNIYKEKKDQGMSDLEIRDYFYQNIII